MPGMQTGWASIPAGAQTLTVTLPISESDAQYQVFCNFAGLTTWSVTSITTTSFLVTVSIKVPTGGLGFSWLTVRSQTPVPG